MRGHPFVSSGITNSTGQIIDACLYCGRTLAAHDTTPPPITIVWQDKTFEFPDAAAALKKGFHLG